VPGSIRYQTRELQGRAATDRQDCDGQTAGVDWRDSMRGASPLPTCRYANDAAMSTPVPVGALASLTQPLIVNGCVSA
jgi:hypothetical protein